MDQAVLQLCDGHMGGGRPHPAPTPRLPRVGTQCSGLGAPLQQGCCLNARQVGVPLGKFHAVYWV